jgi:hypothetical protein
MVTMWWMIAELVDIISFLDRNLEKLTYQRTLFPAPATKGKTNKQKNKISPCGNVGGGHKLTFPLDPKRRTLLRPFPF